MGCDFILWIKKEQHFIFFCVPQRKGSHKGWIFILHKVKLNDQKDRICLGQHNRGLLVNLYPLDVGGYRVHVFSLTVYGIQDSE